MKEIQVFLRPAPGAKPEFLAKLKPVDPNPSASKVWDAVSASISNNTVVLDGYTREGWAWKPDKSNSLITIIAESTDGRNKLPGFVKHLKDRQKSAWGRFGTSGVWIVSYVQTSGKNNPNRMDCRISTNLQNIPNCNLKPLAPKPAATSPPAPAPAVRPAALSSSSSPTTKKKGGGLLGKLVGAQQRTNQHVAASHAQPPRVVTGGDAPAAAPPDTSTAAKTVQEVNAEFRQFCQDTMLDFDISPEQVLKVPISLKETTEGLPESEKPKVTMDILKYMVYEAAEEVNDEWVAVKEPSEFMDEVVIAVYKEGAAPPEVLEDLNKGELPDEVRGQQQAVQQERARFMASQESRHKQQLEQQAHAALEEDEEDELEVLNTKKRDRRTIEDYERAKRDNAAAAGKRGRT